MNQVRKNIHYRSKNLIKLRLGLSNRFISGRFSSQNVFERASKPRLQRKSVEMTIPDACRTLQNLYADNGNQWKDILGWESKTEFSSKIGQKSYLVKLSIFL